VNQLNTAPGFSRSDGSIASLTNYCGPFQPFKTFNRFAPFKTFKAGNRSRLGPGGGSSVQKFKDLLKPRPVPNAPIVQSLRLRNTEARSNRSSRSTATLRSSR